MPKFYEKKTHDLCQGASIVS